MKKEKEINNESMINVSMAKTYHDVMEMYDKERKKYKLLFLETYDQLSDEERIEFGKEVGYLE